MAKRLKDILDLIKLDLEERNTLTRDQWNGICAIKVTIDERLMRNYWKALINAGVLKQLNARTFKIDQDRMYDIIIADAPKPAEEESPEASP